MVLSRSSNWPRYLVPATISERSRPSTRLSARKLGTSPSAMRWARPSTMAVLPTPGSPISTGIVLGAAAENLDDALEFAVAAHQRIELPVHGGLGQVAAELGQQAGLALALLRRSFLLRHAGQLVANLRQLQAALLQNLRGKALLFAQQAQQQMFGADVLVAQPLGLFRRIGQHPLALVRERQVDARSRPSRGWWCAPQSACGSTPPRRASAESGWSTPCPRATGRAAGARSRYRASRTGWPHTARRRSRAVPSPYSVRT